MDVDSGCEDLSVNAINAAPNGATYTWNISGGSPFTSSSHSQSFLFTSPGVNTMSLFVDSIGCSAGDTIDVVVFPGPDVSFTYSPLSGCTDIDVSLNNTSPIIFGDSYLWTFGNGNTDTLYSPPNQIFSNTNNINDSIIPIKLAIYTESGCNDSLIQNVTVHPIPNTTFVASDTIVCEKTNITFQNNSVGGIYYKWSFGDGDTSVNFSPVHSYDTAGTYLVTLISTSFWACRDTSYQTIVVNPNPVAQFNTENVCYSYYTPFTDSSLFNPIVWNWDFGDGNNSSAQNPTHLYSTDSIFTVSLLVSNVFGCSDSISKSVAVYDRPVANFWNSVSCAKNSTFFYDSSSASPIKWSWDFGDGVTDSVKNPNHIYALGGNYTVTLIVENASGCIDTITKVLTISTVPQTYFTANTVCLGTPTTFVDSTILGYPATSYFWDFGDGNFSSLQNPVYQYLNDGVYYVSLTVTNINNCDSTYFDSVFVNKKPVANFTYDTVCFGNTTQFVRSVSPNSPVYYIWNYGDGTALDTNVSPTINYTYATDGTYLVSLKIINMTGCEDSIAHTIIVRSNPIAQFSPQVDTLCLGDSVTFLNSSLFTTNNYWSFGDGNFDSTVNPTHSFSTFGLFDIKLIVENRFGCVDSLTDTIIVLPNPIANYSIDTVCLNNPTTFTNLSSGSNLSWNWSFGDGNSSNIQNPSHIYGNDSSFKTTLTVTTPFGCNDSSSISALVLPIVDAQFNYSLACISRVINFTDSSLGTPNSWRWNFGDGTTSTNQNPSHSYAATGNYSVSLIVSNTSGCSDTITQIVYVNSIPVPDFTNDTVCLGNSMNFINLTTNSQPITTYLWDFGDGNNSFGNNPSYNYPAAGTYTVTLTVTNNGGCDSSISKQVIVNANPVANFTHDTVCLGLSTTFNDVSSGLPISWRWNFGDFSPVDSTSGANVSHTYATSGLHTVTLNIKSGANGCSSQSIKYVSVLVGVDASFTVPSPLCERNSVQFLNTSTTTSAVLTRSKWKFGDGDTSNITSPFHTYANNGRNMVVLSIVSSQGCIDSDSTLVVVNNSPFANFGFTENSCLGLTTNYYDSSTISVDSITNWNWDFGNLNTSTLQNPTNFYATSGTYPITLTVTSDSGCSDILTKNITIIPKATVNFTYKSTCLGDSMLFTDLSVPFARDTIGSWLWEFGDGTISTLRNPSHQYNGTTQSFLVKLTVTSIYGCSNDTSIWVTHLPVASFNFGPHSFGYCEGEIVTFYDSSSIPPPASIVAWEWDFGNRHKSFSKNPSHLYDSAGNYTIKLTTTSTYGCRLTDSLLLPLTIHPNPIASFLTEPSFVSVFNPEIYFNNTSSGAVSYLWEFGDGTSSTNDYPTHYFPKEVGFYTTKLIAFSPFGCLDSTVKTIYVKDEFTLYTPNAFTPEKDFNKLFLIKGYQINDFNLKIFNRWGEMVFESKDENEGWDGTKNGNNCPMGVYVFVVTVKDNIGNLHSKKGHLSLIR